MKNTFIANSFHCVVLSSVSCFDDVNWEASQLWDIESIKNFPYWNISICLKTIDVFYSIKLADILGADRISKILKVYKWKNFHIRQGLASIVPNPNLQTCMWVRWFCSKICPKFAGLENFHMNYVRNEENELIPSSCTSPRRVTLLGLHFSATLQGYTFLPNASPKSVTLALLLALAFCH